MQETFGNKNLLLPSAWCLLPSFYHTKKNNNNNNNKKKEEQEQKPKQGRYAICWLSQPPGIQKPTKRRYSNQTSLSRTYIDPFTDMFCCEMKAGQLSLHHL